jgi:predicted dehydrogenase
MKIFTACIVGAGHIAKVHHVPGLRAHASRVRLAAVHDIDTSRAHAFAHEHDIPRAYDDVAAMLASERPDLVHICTPPALHASLAIQCMEAGAHVYCEKPLCASLAELDLINAAEKRTGRTCAVVSQTRYGSSMRHVQATLTSGIAGRPLVAICHTLWFRPASYYQVPWRGRWSTELGGATISQGIHAMDRLLFLLGEWTQIRAVVRTLDRHIEVDDFSVAIIEFANGCVATVVNSVLSPREESYLRIDLQQASVELRHLYDFSNEHWRFTGTPEAPPEVIAQLRALPPDVPASHAAQIGLLLDDLERGRPHMTAGEEARRTLELLTALYKSGFTGLPVRRGSIGEGDPFYRSFHGSQ